MRAITVEPLFVSPRGCCFYRLEFDETWHCLWPEDFRFATESSSADMEVTASRVCRSDVVNEFLESRLATRDTSHRSEEGISRVRATASSSRYTPPSRCSYLRSEERRVGKEGRARRG